MLGRIERQTDNRAVVAYKAVSHSASDLTQRLMCNIVLILGPPPQQARRASHELQNSPVSWRNFSFPAYETYHNGFVTSSAPSGPTICGNRPTRSLPPAISTLRPRRPLLGLTSASAFPRRPAALPHGCARRRGVSRCNGRASSPPDFSAWRCGVCDGHRHRRG